MSVPVTESIDTSFILKKSSKLIIPKKNESKTDSIKRMTHLYMNNKKINRIGQLATCINLTVLYLHENQIKKIENLNPLEHLTLLYLHNNQISKIENLENLRKLRKLYLGHNNISVIEGLENLNLLEELHVEKQNLQKSDSLCMDPRSILGIRQSMKVLNVSNDNLTNLLDVKLLYNLKTLVAKNNNITNLEKAASDLTDMVYLRDISLKGNPIDKIQKYRDRLIVHSYKLLTIDDKEVNENTRIFLKNFERQKIASAEKQAEESIGVNIPNIASGVPPCIQKAITKSINRYKLNSGPTLSEAVSTTMLEPPHTGNFSVTEEHPIIGASIESVSYDVPDNSEMDDYIAWNVLPHGGSRPRLRKPWSRRARSATIIRKIKSVESAPQLEVTENLY